MVLTIRIPERSHLRWARLFTLDGVRLVPSPGVVYLTVPGYNSCTFRARTVHLGVFNHFDRSARLPAIRRPESIGMVYVGRTYSCTTVTPAHILGSTRAIRRRPTGRGDSGFIL